MSLLFIEEYSIPLNQVKKGLILKALWELLQKDVPPIFI